MGSCDRSFSRERRPAGLPAFPGLATLVLLTFVLGANHDAELGSQSPSRGWGASLDYQTRGDHSEGMTLDPRNDDALRLISAIADVTPRETYSSWPKGLRLRFYLPGQHQPDLRIRQFKSTLGYYALDRLVARSWRSGSINEFEWPIDVIAGVYELQYPPGAGAVSREDWMAQLGITVYLDENKAETTGTTGNGRQPDPTGKAPQGELPPRIEPVQIVAPATIYHSTRPLNTDAYVFSFRTTGAADIKAEVLDAARRPVFSRTPSRVEAGSPYSVRWKPAASQPEGWYSLSVDAAFVEGKRTQQQVVRFYHHRP